jgi:hypothetical protein
MFERLLLRGKENQSRRSARWRPFLERLESRTLLSFIAPRNQDFNGLSTTGITTGDFTGNHIQDVAVVSNSNVLVFLGNGDGTFQPPQSIPVGIDPAGIAVADLTHGGHDDLVVTHFNEGDPRNTVSVLLSNGDGTFQPAVDYQAGDNPHGIAIGDFTGTGIPDIVVTNEGFFVHDQFQPGTTVNVLLGNGDGTFRPTRAFSTGVTPEAVAVGDFSGNGRLSIVTADQGFGSIPGDVGFLVGNGDGTFRPPILLGLSLNGGAARSVAVGDLTGTGKLDIVAAVEGGTNGVGVLLGNGNGSFQDPVIYPASPGTDSLPIHVALGDFNGDSKPDIAVQSFLGSGPGLDVLVNNGDGTFRAPTEVTSGFGIGVMAVGDFTGDNSADLAVATSDVLSIYLRQPGGLFKTPTILATGPGTSFLQTADLRQDGTADLIIANAQNNTVGVMLGNGDGTFQAPVTYGVGHNPQEVIVVDLLNDGVLDLVAVNLDDRTLSVLMGNGDGTFQAAQTITLNAPSNFAPVRVVAGDLEHNGNIDLVVLERDNNGQGSGLMILHGNGDGTFNEDPVQRIVPRVNDPTGRITFKAADLRNNGNLDLILATPQAGSAVVFLGNGDGTFGPQQGVRLGTDSNDGVTSMALVDLTGNGVLDMVVSVFNFFRNDNVIVAMGNGDGTFQAAVRYHVAGAATSVVVADFNGDGIPDVAVTEWGLLGGAHNGDSLSVILGLGDGTFGPPTNYGIGTGTENLVAADFNGDGATDLALLNRVHGDLNVVFNANDGTAPNRAGIVRRQLGTALGHPTAVPSQVISVATPSPASESRILDSLFAAAEQRPVSSASPQRMSLEVVASELWYDGLAADPLFP